YRRAVEDFDRLKALRHEMPNEPNVGVESEPEDIVPIEELNWELPHIRLRQQKEASRARPNEPTTVVPNEANEAVPNEPNSPAPGNLPDQHEAGSNSQLVDFREKGNPTDAGPRRFPDFQGGGQT